jgi:hypothetical protein
VGNYIFAIVGVPFPREAGLARGVEFGISSVVRIVTSGRAD